MQTLDTFITYPHGLNALNVCENEMLMVKDLFFENLHWNSVTTLNTQKPTRNW